MLISIQFGWFPRFHFSGPHLLKWFSEERRMRREMEEHNDLVFLPVTEGYRMNSRKVRDCDGCDGCWHRNDMEWLVWISWQLRMAGVSGWSYSQSHSPSLDAWLPLCWRSDFSWWENHVIPFLGWLSGQSHPDSPEVWNRLRNPQKTWQVSPLGWLEQCSGTGYRGKLVTLW